MLGSKSNTCMNELAKINDNLESRSIELMYHISVLINSFMKIKKSLIFLQDFYFPTETLLRKLRATMDAGFLF